MEQLLRRHHDRVHQLARRLLGNPADAADAAQEALIAVVRGIHRFDGQAAFTTWLYRVATNACLDEIRRRNRRPLPVDPVFDDATSTGSTSANTAATDRVLDRLVLEEALPKLPIEFRTALVLRDVCDLEYAEIASVLDIPPGTVRSRIARGRAQLAVLVRAERPPPPEASP